MSIERSRFVIRPTCLHGGISARTTRMRCVTVSCGGLFARSRNRESVFSLQAGDLTLDYSRNHLTKKTLGYLTQLARQADVPAAIEAMFGGEKINQTEDRSVLHVALRAKIADRVALDVDGVAEIFEVLTRIEEFVDDVQSGRIGGSSGKRFTDIVNIGIGGSDLGPVMASRALKPYWKDGLRFHAVSNIDGTQLSDLKAELDPETTLFVICSKTFTTLETMTNAEAAKSVGRRPSRRERGAIPLRRRVDESRGDGQIRDSAGVQVRILGLGGWPLLALVRRRSFAGAGYRHGQFQGDPGWRPAHGFAFSPGGIGSRTCRCYSL